MAISPLAGKPAPKELLVDLARLEREYFERRPDLDDPAQRVSFGTSGHRGSPLRGSFTETHILAITQAICDYRRAHATDGPLRQGHAALSGPAQRTAPGVLAANSVHTIIQRDDDLLTPVTRAPSSSITALAPTTSPTALSSPSHNPPRRAGSNTT
jgi:phosphoglucomutase